MFVGGDGFPPLDSGGADSDDSAGSPVTLGPLPLLATCCSCFLCLFMVFVCVDEGDLVLSVVPFNMFLGVC